MIVRAKLSALRQSAWYEHVIRFGLGGMTTVCAGLIARQWGPVVGGLFLAVPAIFCASTTLIEKHERERKQKAGLRGKRRGEQAAALDATGTTIGSLALMVFAAVAWQLMSLLPAVALGLAMAAWLTTATVAWWLWRSLRDSLNRRNIGPP